MALTASLIGENDLDGILAQEEVLTVMTEETSRPLWKLKSPLRKTKRLEADRLSSPIGVQATEDKGQEGRRVSPALR